MRIKIIEIEATSEDLRANRTLSDVLMDVLNRSLMYSNVQGCEEQENEEGDRTE